MTAVAFNQQQLKFCDFPEIPLDDIDELCGEVYITLNGTLIFHCSLCGNSYGSVDNYLEHLSKLHYKADLEEEIKNEANDEKSDGEILNENISNDKQCHEQKLATTSNDVGNRDCVIDVDSDDAINVKKDPYDDYDVEEDLEDDINDDDIDEYEEMCQNGEATSSDDSNSDYKEFDALEMKDKTIKTSGTRYPLEKNSTPKPKRKYRKKVRQFICKVCGKEFKLNVLLKRHLQIHSDERKYKCYICDFAFKDRSNLDSHVRRHLGTNKIECGYCPKTFFTQTEVRNHRRVHTGERPFACTICDKAYTTPNRLKMHNKRHTSEPLYTCSFCKKGFYERFRYEDHILVHTKEKNFICEICAASFPRHKSWMRHTKLHEKSS